VIVESTYGTQHHGPREVRERNFLDKVVNTVKKGGRVLIPIVAIGRAQVGVSSTQRRPWTRQGGGWRLDA
jgi:predicted metal-dependent RNase